MDFIVDKFGQRLLISFELDLDTVRNMFSLCSRVHVDLLCGFLLGEAEEKDQRPRAEGQGMKKKITSVF